MRYAREHGFPVPAVYEVTETDIVMDRIEGPTMLAELIRRPWRFPVQAAILATLHQRLHAIPAPPWLPAPFGEGGVLVHLDLHPQNVLLTHGGPVVIDWPNAVRGAGEHDVAQTWVILATADMPGPTVHRWLGRGLRRLFLRSFLRGFVRRAVARQLPAVAARWLRDRNVQPSERRATERLLRREGRA
jgi:aminoglycoside phosphotransferase (APT) family kinase protein